MRDHRNVPSNRFVIWVALMTCGWQTAPIIATATEDQRPAVLGTIAASGTTVELTTVAKSASSGATDNPVLMNLPRSGTVKYESNSNFLIYAPSGDATRDTFSYLTVGPTGEFKGYAEVAYEPLVGRLTQTAWRFDARSASWQIAGQLLLTGPAVAGPVGFGLAREEDGAFVHVGVPLALDRTAVPLVATASKVVAGLAVTRHTSGTAMALGQPQPTSESENNSATFSALMVEVEDPPKPSIDFPKDIPKDQSPGPGFVWKGAPGSVPGDSKGTWYNKDTDESLWNDMNHEPPIGPHWDYWAPGKKGKWRWFPDGRMEKAD